MDQHVPLAASPPSHEAYEFSNDWFGYSAAVWDAVIPAFNPSKILEVGSYEGRSTC